MKKLLTFACAAVLGISLIGCADTKPVTPVTPAPAPGTPAPDAGATPAPDAAATPAPEEKK
jgi:hypothetical protein